MVAFKVLEHNSKYENDLNIVYKHIGCGHVFSLGEPRVLAAYAAGELVPRSSLPSREEVAALREEISELRAELNSQKSKEEGRAATT